MSDIRILLVTFGVLIGCLVVMIIINLSLTLHMRAFLRQLQTPQEERVVRFDMNIPFAGQGFSSPYDMLENLPVTTMVDIDETGPMIKGEEEPEC